MASTQTVNETALPDLRLVRRGKVRDVYEVDDGHLLVVATDRISAFDCVLPTRIRRKGEVLTALSRFWFERLSHITPHHLVTTEVEEMPDGEVFPVECVVRGYLAGSGWKDYQRTGETSGHRLPEGLRESDRLPEPIFTPATKAEEGHDENISEARMRETIGEEATAHLRDTSLALYREAASYAEGRGIIIADTKFEFGRDAEGRVLLIDEALTPDSSRFWPRDEYQPGCPQNSFDKQYVRDYLEGLAWDKRPPAPPLPPEVSDATTARYLQAYKLLTGTSLESGV
jgi:phosphoribosylaminoimidazole-succinocarboxamide synthase